MVFCDSKKIWQHWKHLRNLFGDNKATRWLRACFQVARFANKATRVQGTFLECFFSNCARHLLPQVYFRTTLNHHHGDKQDQSCFHCADHRLNKATNDSAATKRMWYATPQCSTTSTTANSTATPTASPPPPTISTTPRPLPAATLLRYANSFKNCTFRFGWQQHLNDCTFKFNDFFRFG